MKNAILFTLCSITWALELPAQSEGNMSWWNPAHHEFPVIEGQAWPDQAADPFDRLPIKAQPLVRKAIWDLSKNSAGLTIRFRSNAEKIVVRYQIAGRHALSHMPATGVSGVDLYAIDSDGKWLWCRGDRNFSDTVSYTFARLQANDGYHQQGREYRLYLPLYNTVNWLEIGVQENSHFRPLPVRLEKPIVVYGTSIAQGACASRPGMAWTSILGRKMDRPLINLGFSGNGRLEQEIVDLLTEIPAKAYILDCLPNLHQADLYDDQNVKERVLSAVRKLREGRLDQPIILVEHAGYTDGFVQPHRLAAYSRVNDLQKEAFDQLTNEGITNLHYLSKEELDLRLDDMVDGTHPNDLGMDRYANGYEKKLREIFDEPIGSVSTTIPVIQYREPDNYDWEERHREVLKLNQHDPPRRVILANSIVHFWGGSPKAKIVREQTSWDELYNPLGVANYAYGWDRIENVLWRVYHDEMDGLNAEKIVIMIGTNNLHLNSNDEIIDGLSLLVNALKVRQPAATLVLMGLLPRRDYENRIKALNDQIKDLAEELTVQHADIGHHFINQNQLIDESLFSDGLHPNVSGYLKIREAFYQVLK